MVDDFMYIVVETDVNDGYDKTKVKTFSSLMYAKNELDKVSEKMKDKMYEELGSEFIGEETSMSSIYYQDGYYATNRWEMTIYQTRTDADVDYTFEQLLADYY